MATRQEIYDAIQRADKVGDSASVRALGSYLKTMPAEVAAPAPPDPTEGMSTTEKVLAGTGKAFVDMGRGVGQLARKVMPDKLADKAGLPTQADIDEAKALDAPLMNTTAGTVGNVIGNVAASIPTVFIPGAAGLRGAMAVGAGTGAIQPVATGESRLKNIAVGAGAGAVGVGLGRVANAAWQGGKALVEPLTAAGQTRIAARTAARFGVTPQSVAGLSDAPTITGARPTLAEAVRDPQAAAGASRLQDAIRIADPETAGALDARMIENNAARVGTLRDLAGAGGARDVAEAARQTAAKQAYGKAFSQDMPAMEGNTYHGGTFTGGKPNEVVYFVDEKPIAQEYADTTARRLGFQGQDASASTASSFNVNPKSVASEQQLVQTAEELGYNVGRGIGQIEAPYLLDKNWMGEQDLARVVNALKQKGYDAVKLADHSPSGNPHPALAYFGDNVSAVASPETQAEVAALMQMPAIKGAVKEAQELALNRGKNLDAAGSIEGLHNMKLVLDDQIAALSNGTASQVNKASSLRAARDRLVSFIESMSSEYKGARTSYAAMSKPINEMDVAGEVLRKGTSATSDLGGNPRIMPDALARSVQDEGRLIKAATGRDLPQKTLADLMEPDKLARLRAVVGEADRVAAVGRAANGPGSATAQRMSSQNVLRQVLGPLGLPQSWAESTMLQTAMRPVQFAYSGVAEPRIQAVLADLALNPARAQQIMAQAQRNPRMLPKSIQEALPYIEQAMRTSGPAIALTGDRRE